MILYLVEKILMRWNLVRIIRKACCVKRSEIYCHTEAFEGEVSNVESKQDFSPMAQNDKTLDSKTHKSLKQLIVFFCIGGGITLLELLGFYILYKIFGVHYILASLIMFVLASGIGVWLYRRFVFGGTHLHRGLEVGLTYLINTIGIGLNTLILWLCVEFLGFEAIVAKILASLLVAFMAFMRESLSFIEKNLNSIFTQKALHQPIKV